MTAKPIVALIAAGWALSLAATANAGPWVFGQGAAPGDPRKVCTCRAGGQDHPLGAIVCLPSPSGPQLARCGTFLNNTSWEFTGQSCVISMPQSRPAFRLAADR